MMAAISPRAEELATMRSELLERARWLAPNSTRGREVRAAIRQLAVEELKLEVASEAESQKSGKPDFGTPVSGAHPSSALRAPRGEGEGPRPLPTRGEGDHGEAGGEDERPPRFWWIGDDR